MGKSQDLTGMRFERLVVIKRAEDYISPKGYKRKQWTCICDCGNTATVSGDYLKTSSHPSCGCYLKEKIEHRREEFVGRKFGRLTVLELAEPHVCPSGEIFPRWRCQCECGNITEVYQSSLVTGSAKSCGCLAKENTAKKNRERCLKHGGSVRGNIDRLYRVWRGMKERCYSEKHKSYKRYGGRGIKVCDEWLHDYEAFRAWSYANGYDENAKYGKCSLDRIDFDGNYCPENCRWVDYKVQANNASYNRLLTLNGETHTLSQWAEITKIPYDRIKQRLQRGYTDEEALTLPLGGKRGNVVRSTSCA